MKLNLHEKWSLRLTQLARYHVRHMSREAAEMHVFRLLRDFWNPSSKELAPDFHVGLLGQSRWDALAHELREQQQLDLDPADVRRSVVFGHGLPGLTAAPLRREVQAFVPIPDSGPGIPAWPRRTGACKEIWSDCVALHPMAEATILDALWGSKTGLVLLGCREESRAPSVCLAQEVVAMTQIVGAVARLDAGIFASDSHISLGGLCEVPVVASLQEAEAQGFRRVLVDRYEISLSEVLEASERLLVIAVQNAASVVRLLECNQPSRRAAVTLFELLIAAVGIGRVAFRGAVYYPLDVYVPTEAPDDEGYDGTLAELGEFASARRAIKWQEVAGSMLNSIDDNVERTAFIANVFGSYGFSREVSHFLLRHRRPGEGGFIAHIDDVELMPDDSRTGLTH